MSTEEVARTVAYAEFLESYHGRRSAHSIGAGDGPFVCRPEDHCHVHQIDEPDSGDVYRMCGECGHVFVTETDLRRDDLRQRERAWQAGLTGQLGEYGVAPVARPADEIDSCPHCTHSF